MATAALPVARPADNGIRFFPATLSVRRPPDKDGKRAAVEPDEEGRIPVALSSEYGVERYDWWNDERYTEVLDHNAKSVDLERVVLGRGLPLSLNHDLWSVDAFMGKVEDITVDGDRVMRGWMRFSKSQRGQEVRQDVLDDLRSSVSIGYRVSEDFESEADEKTGKVTRRYLQWQPLELSLVPVPADPTVGAGRSALSSTQIDDLQSLRAKARELDELKRTNDTPVDMPAPTRANDAPAPPTDSAQSPQERTMPDNPTPAAAIPAAPSNAPDLSVVRAEIQKEAADRVRQYGEIVGLAKMPPDTVQKWIAGDVPIAAALAEARAHIAKNVPEAVPNGGPIVDVDAKTAKRYSFARAILSSIAGDPRHNDGLSKIDFGVEREMAQEIRRAAPHVAARTNNMLLPSMMQTRAGLASDEATKGQTLVYSQPGEFIDVLRNKAVLLRAGARMISGLTGSLVMPRQSASATAVWYNENPGSGASITEMTLGSATLAMKSLIGVTAYTRQLLIAAASGNADVEALVRDDLAAVFALALDAAGIKGGGSEEPSGWLSHTGIGSVTLGAQGGTLTYAKIVELETVVAAANGDSGKLAYIGTPEQRGFMRKLYNVNPTYGTVPVWTNAPAVDGLPQGIVNGYNAFASNQVPKNLSPGTTTTLASAFLFGDVEQVVFGEWGAFDVLVDPYSLAGEGKIKVIGTQFADVVIRQYQKLAACQQVLNSTL